jgi:hypothetical protein
MVFPCLEMRSAKATDPPPFAPFLGIGCGSSQYGEMAAEVRNWEKSRPSLYFIDEAAGQMYQ